MTPTRLPGIGTRSRWVQGGLILIASGSYVLAFVPVHRIAGSSAATLAALPVALTGWFLGTRAGLVAGLVGASFNVLLFSLVREPVFDPGELLSGVLVVATGTMAGGLRDLFERSQELAHVRAALEAESVRRQQVEEELQGLREAPEAADRTGTEFLSRIGHDVRTPLGVIIGYCELLREQAEELSYADLIPDLDKILIASQDLLAFVDDILNLSRIQRDTIKLYPEVFQIKTLIRDLAAEARPLVERNGNTLNVRYTNDVGTMRADLVKAQQLLLNILRETTRLTHQGLVTLGVTRETVPEGGEWIRFHVTNTGSGIKPGRRQHLLQSLTQSEGAHASQHDVVSLGLTISRHYCQIMGGTIHAESTTGTGFAVTVYLPVDAPDQQGKNTSPPTHTASA